MKNLYVNRSRTLKKGEIGKGPIIYWMHRDQQVYDRVWLEHTVFEKVRYMNARGCARKFDVQKFIDTVEKL